MKKQHLILISFIAATAVTASAQTYGKTNVLDIKESITDNTIIFPESYETDTQKLLEGWYLTNYTATDNKYSAAEDVETSDSEIISRLKALPTAIEMPFNQVVRSYIDRYTKQARPQVAAILGLGIYYMPIFEQALEAEGLPLELKYLPVIESGLDPNAVSRHGATGLWQFMIGTAQSLGMEVNTLVDERRDPYTASEKAASYLKDLHNAYGDWTLAIAAYNCGPGTVNKALRRAGSDPKQLDFWSIYQYLPAETRGYVPMFIAANYVMNYYPKHNISPVLPTKPLVTDTVSISQRVHFNQIAAVLDIPVEEIRMLNPQFRRDVVPATSDRLYSLVLPSRQALAYIVSEDAIKNYDAEKYSRQEVAEPVVAQTVQETAAEAEAADELAEVRAAAAQRTGTHTVTHKVIAGETLSSIAAKYDVTEADIKNWNGLRRNAVRTGQQLRINTSVEGEGKELASATQSNTRGDSAASSSAKTSTASKAASAPKTHIVKSGETLSSIAAKYGVTVAQLKNANSLTGDVIKAGGKLKIPAKTGAKKSATPAAKKRSKKRRR